MDFFYFFIGGFVIFIFIVRRELLIDRTSQVIILGVSVAFFIAGLVLHFTPTARQSISGALLAPLLTLGWFRLCRRLFVALLGREPKNTFLKSGPGLAPDMLFNLLYGVTSAFFLMFFSVGMEKLAKAGW